VKLAVALVCVTVASAAWADAPKMVKGPYLQNLAPQSITVMWQLEVPAAARVTVTGPGGEKSVEVAAGPVGEATIAGLTPASRYRYRVEAAGAAWEGELRTAPPIGAAVPFSFLVMGDSRDGAEAHRRVVERAAEEVPDFVLGTGDMVDDGAKAEQWQAFFDIESAQMRDNVYYPAIGNHDRQGRGRTADTYRELFAVPDNGADSERYYAFTYANARFLVLDSNEYSFALTDQTAWLERELIAARQDPQIQHIFCVMHHPPFSISLHGGNRDLRERWTPLFEKYQVSAVFAGHDHVYERAEHEGIRYFVTGGAGAPLYPKRPHPSAIDAEAVKKFERAYHFLRVTLTGNRIEVTAVRVDGTTIETTSWLDGEAVQSGAPPAAVPPAPAAVVAPVAAPAAAADGPSGILWLALAAVVLALGAAVVVVRTLR
jgi:predicted phosphodiesterase